MGEVEVMGRLGGRRPKGVGVREGDVIWRPYAYGELPAVQRSKQILR